MDGDQRSDDELARQAGGGDEAAFAELHRRYFGRVYDFALRLARDRDVAALVVQSSFLRAYQGLRTGERQGPFKLGLFARAHHHVAERLRRRRRPVLEGEEAFAMADPARLAYPALAAELPDLAHMAWQAARQLKLDEYELLDLSVRQQFDVAEIAAILRTRPEAVQTKLARLRDALEESFTSLLLLSRGRRECLDLDFLVGDDQWSASLRRRIQRHLQSCQICRGTRRRYLSVSEALAALTPVPAPVGWQETILDRLQDAVRTGAMAAAPAPVAPAVTPPPPRQPSGVLSDLAGGGGGIGAWFGCLFGGGGARGPLLAVLGGGLLVVIVALAALCGAGAFDGGEAAPTPTTSPTATASASATPTPSATPTATATSTSLPPPTATAAPPTSTPAPPTSTPVSPTATPRSPTATPLPPATATALPTPMDTP